MPSRQKSHGKRISEVPLFSGPVGMLAIPALWASSKSAKNNTLLGEAVRGPFEGHYKPPVELVVVT